MKAWGIQPELLRQNMKKIIIGLAFCVLLLRPATADSQNPIFGESLNQVGIYGGMRIGSDNTSEHYNGFAMLQYSQPARLFRLDGRLNVQAGYVNSKTYPWFVGGVSLDLIPFAWRGFWTGIGFGGFIRNEPSQRVDSRFTFGERVFIGRHISDRISMELFYQHFSNGDLTQRNLGYDFVGISANLNF